MSTLGIGSYFSGARVRQQYYRDPLAVLLESSGNWRPPQKQQQRQIAKKVAGFKPASDFAIKLAEASKKLGLS